MRATTMRTAYVIQPYRREERELTYGQPLRIESEPQAVRRAAEMAKHCAGVDVLEMQYDPIVDYCGDARVIASFGDVPQ